MMQEEKPPEPNKNNKIFTPVTDLDRDPQRSADSTIRLYKSKTIIKAFDQMYTDENVRNNILRKDYSKEPSVMNQETDLCNAINEFEKYSKNLERYARVTYPSKTSHETFRHHMKSLMPNIEYEEARGKYSYHSQMKWIINIENFMKGFNNYVNVQLQISMHKIFVNSIQKLRRDMFDMNMMQVLPEDVIKNIHSYLPIETHIDILKAKYYPIIKERLSKLTVPKLKGISERFIEKPMINLYRNLHFYNREAIIGCLPKTFQSRPRSKTKSGIIDHLLTIIDTYHSPDPKNKEAVDYFQKQALNIFKNIIYITRPKEVPMKLEKPTKTKRTTKSRIKSTAALEAQVGIILSSTMAPLS
jgi:hypothetical protein